MRTTSAEEAQHDRATLDGRIAFVTAAFVLAYAFTALLDRVGAPERFVAAAPPYFTLAALALLGFLLHSMRVSLYYTAGRVVPAAYAGFANAAILMGLALPFASRFAARPWLTGLCGGFFLGAAAATLYLGPLLRKTGVFSLPGLLAARFPGRAPRLGVIAAAAAASSLIALAGQQIAVDALVNVAGAGRVFAAFLAGVAMLLIAGPGGLHGVIWAAAAAAGVTLAGFVWPLATIGLKSGAVFSPLGGESWRSATLLLDSWRVIPPAAGFVVDLATALATALGVLALAPVLAPAVAARDVASARRAGVAALFWTFTLALLAAMAVVAAALALTRESVGQAPERLPDAVYAASSRGLVTICGARLDDPSHARRLCAARGLDPGAPLRAEDVKVASGGYLLVGLPELAGAGAAFSGLLASGLIALGLVLAASGLQACATALGHEALYRMRGETDLTSRRLALARAALVGVTAVGSAASAASLFEAQQLVSLALGLSAAVVAPVLALAFWPRAGDRDALIAMAAGLMGMFAALAANGGAKTPDAVALASLAGAVFGGAAGVLSAFASPSGQAAPGSAFVARILRGDGEILEPDKGA
jgi:cation/acetate symporter